MYFSNSTHGQTFELKNCEGCARHKPDDPDGDCPLKLAAFIHNGSSGEAAELLNIFQRREGDHDQVGTCFMRVELPAPDVLDLNLTGRQLPNVPSCMEPWTPKDQARVHLHDARRAFERREYHEARRSTGAAYEELRALAPLPWDSGNVRDSPTWPKAGSYPKVEGSDDEE